MSNEGNWQLEEKVIELTRRVNELTVAVERLYIAILNAPVRMNTTGRIELPPFTIDKPLPQLDYSPKPTEPYRPYMVPTTEEDVS